MSEVNKLRQLNKQGKEVGEKKPQMNPGEAWNVGKIQELLPQTIRRSSKTGKRKQNMIVNKTSQVLLTRLQFS